MMYTSLKKQFLALFSGTMQNNPEYVTKLKFLKLVPFCDIIEVKYDLHLPKVRSNAVKTV